MNSRKISLGKDKTEMSSLYLKLNGHALKGSRDKKQLALLKNFGKKYTRTPVTIARKGVS